MAENEQQEIVRLTDGLRETIIRDRPDDASLHAVRLLAIGLINLDRIADALEQIALQGQGR